MKDKIKFHSATENLNHKQVFEVLPKNVLKNKKDLHLIDVRRPEEYSGELGHIKGSELLTVDELPQKIDSLPKDKTIVFICRTGNRSGIATAFAQENGLNSVYNMKGGMVLWNELNLEVEK